MLFKILGVLSALIFIAGDIPYLKDSIKGTTKPQRVTWGVVFALNAIGFANQYASGADNSLWLFGAAVFMTGAIFAASIKNGVGGYAKLDIFSIVASAAGIALWLLFKNPVYSIFANLFVAVVALIPTFIKAKKIPESETKIAWLAGSISALLAAISVGKLDWQLLILPVASCVLQAYMVFLLYVVARKK